MIVKSIENIYNYGNLAFQVIPTVSSLTTRIQATVEGSLNFLDTAYRTGKTYPITTTIAVFSTINLLGYGVRVPAILNIFGLASSSLILADYSRCIRHNLALCDRLEAILQDFDKIVQNDADADTSEKHLSGLLQEAGDANKEDFVFPLVLPIAFKPSRLQKEASIKKLDVFKDFVDRKNNNRSYKIYSGSIEEEIRRMKEVIKDVRNYHSNYFAQVW